MNSCRSYLMILARPSMLLFSLIGLATTSGHGAMQAKETGSVQFLNSKTSSAPFSSAVRVGNQLYLSGQLGLLPGTSSLAPGGIQAETKQAMLNIKNLLSNSGYTMKDVVKCTVFLADMREFPAFNKEYLSFFAQPYPARSAIGINSLAFGGRVEIECMASH